jgi:tetratricopeptide (TPR) repeat protein
MHSHKVFLPLLLTGCAFAQYPGLTLPPSGNNQKAAVIQYIGPVKVEIEYSSPAVHGPDGKDRRGQIWGKLVPYGMADLGGFGNDKPGPWRAGANENSVFTVSDNVTIEGKTLPAGRYGLHMIPGKDEWTLIFSKDSRAWGSFFYEEANDALRVAVKAHPHEYREYLTYEFMSRKPEEATAELQWEELAVGWNIKVPNANDIYISNIRQQLTNSTGFSYLAYLNAVRFCLQNDTHLEDALAWSDAAIKMPFVGQTNFNTLSTKAQVLTKLKRDDEAAKVMDAALHLPTTTAIDIHGYARQLQTQKNQAEAMKLFRYNAERNGDAWPVHVGLARYYAASGDLPKALEHAQKALGQAPDPLNKKSLEGMVKNFSEGKNIEQ